MYGIPVHMLVSDLNLLLCLVKVSVQLCFQYYFVSKDVVQLQTTQALRPLECDDMDKIDE